DPDEDDLVVDEFRKLIPSCPRMLLMLVPRRPERFEEAAQKLQAAGIPFVRRSQLTETTSLTLPGVLLVATMGELVSLFPLAAIVCRGGTMEHRGGHNIPEPSFFGKPVIIGQHMENFPDIAEEFRGRAAVVSIGSGEELAAAVLRLWQDETLLNQTGERARE